MPERVAKLPPPFVRWWRGTCGPELQLLLASYASETAHCCLHYHCYLFCHHETRRES